KKSHIPTVASISATMITETTATSGGNIISNGGEEITARGVCWSTNQNPTISDNNTSDGTGIGSFTSLITGLVPGKNYYLRAYATNSVGTAYGDQITIAAPAILATITTTEASLVTSTTASCGGKITSDGGAEITSKGVCWSKNQNPTLSDSKTTDGTGSNSFTSAITELTPGTIYWIRAYATNSAGTAYGNQIMISALAVLPTITTTMVTYASASSVSAGGNIKNDGGAQITEKGVCWSTNQDPTISDNKTTEGTGTGAFSSSISGLTVGITYYTRAYATNSFGTAYGDQMIFTLTSGGVSVSVSDIDGNIYHTVTIGSQVWMVEDLKTTKYRNGDNVTNVTETSWSGLTSGAYCWYKNDISYKPVYGAMYNWYAVIDSRNIAPAGWHVASDAEWKTLSDFLGGSDVAGGKMKETGTAHWDDPNAYSTNESGFTAVAGGFRDQNVAFEFRGSECEWWSSSFEDPCQIFWAVSVQTTKLYRIILITPNAGRYIRCLKD
ncbi:MAG TPA: fibrobacter succinogenes major paralogous domain-containing protein, partial [Bacteroidales bacterium]|nr:fibrobacter succinogenes major paralogous domain-containing protein [Bacteroidales bacterium]